MNAPFLYPDLRGGSYSPLTLSRVWSKPVGDGEGKGDKEESAFQPTTDDHTPLSLSLFFGQATHQVSCGSLILEVFGFRIGN